MSIFKSWNKLFVLALFVCFFVGCGGGGSNSNDVAYSPNTPSWDTYDPRFDNNAPTPEHTVPNTEPEPTTPVQPDPTPDTPAPEPTTPEPTPTPDITPVQPEPTPDTPASEPTTPEPEPTLTPTPEPTPTTDTYTDTYDIASVLNGDWYGVSGSGIAIGSNGTFNLIMSQIKISIVNTQITGNVGTLYITYRHYWDCNEDIYNTYLLYGDAELRNMAHVGNNKGKQ